MAWPWLPFCSLHAVYNCIHMYMKSGWEMHRARKNANARVPHHHHPTKRQNLLYRVSLQCKCGFFSLVQVLSFWPEFVSGTLLFLLERRAIVVSPCNICFTNGSNFKYDVILIYYSCACSHAVWVRFHFHFTRLVEAASIHFTVGLTIWC